MSDNKMILGNVDVKDLRLGSVQVLSAYMGSELVWPIGSQGQPSNEIWYTSTDSATVTPYKTSEWEGTIVSNTYSDGKGVIRFSRNITEIPAEAFRGCYTLETISLPQSVTAIGAHSNDMGCFFGCSSLTEVNVGNELESIGNDAFWRCNLTGFTIPDTVSGQLLECFAHNANLKSMSIPDGVTNINSTFRLCSSLSSVTIGSGVTAMQETFENCSAFTQMTITCSPPVINTGTSNYGTFLHVQPTGTIFCLPNDYNAYMTWKNSDRYISGWNVVTLDYMSIKDQVENGIITEITGVYSTIMEKWINDGNSVSMDFHDIGTLTKVELDNLEHVQGTSFANTFVNCSALTSVSFNSLVDISGNNLFANAFRATDIHEIEFPSLTGISGYRCFDWAFSFNESITKFSCPELRSVSGDYALNLLFYECNDHLQEINLPKLSAINGENVFYEFLNGAKSIESATIHPNTVSGEGNSNILGTAGNELNNLEYLRLTDYATEDVRLKKCNALDFDSVLSVLEHLGQVNGKDCYFFDENLTINDDMDGTLQAAYDAAENRGWTIHYLNIMPIV